MFRGLRVFAMDDVRCDPADWCSAAPKQKGQKMSIGSFLADESMCIWHVPERVVMADVD